MHGVSRNAPVPAEHSASKAAELRALQSQFLHNHHHNIYTKEALAVSADLLEANPEFMTAWNYRKLAVEHYLNNRSEAEEADSDFLKSILDVELRVVESALKKNFKSYGAWYHRKWVLSKGHSSTERELKLLNLFQKMDSRNFHAWNYRRFVAALKNISKETELQYTTDMINDNFSNYSAWHNRSVLLSHLLKIKADGYFPKENVLMEEYDFVRSALFTDPDDQSGWFYHLWLLDQTVNLGIPTLVSAWPPHGSDICVPIDQDGCALPPFSSSQAKAGTFPVILYFNEIVEGVNSSTVTVETEKDGNMNLSWSPLSTNSFGCAQAWVTHLNFPNYEFHSSKAYPVKVTIGHSQGIISLNGVPYSRPSYVAFTVGTRPHDSQHAEGQCLGRISMRDESFCMNGTDNKDSSPLLNCLYPLITNEEDEPTWNHEIIANEIAHCRELLSEVECKIGKLTLARLLTAHDAMSLKSSPTASNSVHSEEVLQLYCDLTKLDPPHSQYYEDEYSLVLLMKVTSSTESLLGYCCQYKDSTSLNISDSTCLRFNNMSLSRIGSFEQLLWVQVLDLSHNKVRSIEGLEALQLLSCLNLSNNKLGTFTALDPLKLLKTLKVLDVSYNEIGAHTVDTRRYLNSSPLSHTVASDWNFEEFSSIDAKVANYWEAYSAFRGLNLTQLDIVGNSVIDERFKLFLRKLLPRLKWLDDEELH